MSKNLTLNNLNFGQKNNLASFALRFPVTARIVVNSGEHATISTQKAYDALEELRQSDLAKQFSGVESKTQH